MLRELANTIREREKPKARRHIRTVRSVPDRKRIYMDMAKLFLQDLSNVEAGIYPLPADRDGPLFASIRRSQLFFEDLPNIHRRRKRRTHNEVLNDTNSRETTPLLPAEFPLSVGRLDDRQFGRAVRHPGRSSF